MTPKFSNSGVEASAGIQREVPPKGTTLLPVLDVKIHRVLVLLGHEFYLLAIRRPLCDLIKRSFWMFLLGLRFRGASLDGRIGLPGLLFIFVRPVLSLGERIVGPDPIFSYT